MTLKGHKNLIAKRAVAIGSPRWQSGVSVRFEVVNPTLANDMVRETPKGPGQRCSSIEHLTDDLFWYQ